MPIWTLNELYGGKSGVMWEAGEYEFFNRKTTFHKRLRSTSSFKNRVELALDWMKKGANFVMIDYQMRKRYGTVLNQVISTRIFLFHGE